MQERLVAMVVTISASAAITLMDLLLSRYIQFLFFIFIIRLSAQGTNEP